ncbi:hypothetical protein [Croceimicrobium hydrocarbonivorans]|uniref:Uncharacterized protein n=1 Tax=Croceimicrobium hydrocarbonivorans TaxID=2761580 RepID=A0A7H0VI77_9FLAO|nr:hypothetical protein [Croceimicrobium hydrocarbonivorans]QNR25425.1 hypothetical protein H4K34_06185 [Croceimicrobium hydrocarbonivorans]
MSLKPLAYLTFISICLSNPLWSQNSFKEVKISFANLVKYPLESSIDLSQNQNNQIPLFNTNLSWGLYKKGNSRFPLYHGFSLGSQFRSYQKPSYAFTQFDYLAYNYGFVSTTPTHTSILTDTKQLKLDLAYGLRYGTNLPFRPGLRSKLNFGLDFHLATPIYIRQEFAHISGEKFEQQLKDALYSNYIDLKLEASLRWHFKLNEQNYLGLLISTTGLLSNLNQSNYLGYISAGISYIYL